jgi:hypothetical protein
MAISLSTSKKDLTDNSGRLDNRHAYCHNVLVINVTFFVDLLTIACRSNIISTLGGVECQGF